MLVANNLRLPVTEQGVHIPRECLGDAVEVVVRKVGEKVLVQLVTASDLEAASKDSASARQDSIWDLGSDPITDDPITDSSVNHDRYLYGPQP
jgi:hypothetical protein